VTFVNISFVGSDALAKELGPVGAAGDHTGRSFPKDAAIPVVGAIRLRSRRAPPTLSQASSR